MAGTTVFFVMAAILLAVGLAGPRRIYRRYRPTRAQEPSDAAFAMARIVAFAAVGLLVFESCSALDAADKSAWSKSEVGEAAKGGALSLEEESRLPDGPSHDYASLIESSVTEAGKGQGPLYRISVERVGKGHDYEISTTDTDATFCMHLTEEKSQGGGFFVPGADDSNTFVPEYDLTATVDDGAC